MDLSDKSMELARTRAAVFGLEERIRFCAGNAEQLSAFLPPEPYDLIYSFGVIHHTPHPDAVLEQLRQYTRPGTTVKIMVYHRRSWKVAWILATEGKGQFWKLPDVVAKNSEAQTGCPVTYTYTRHEGRQLLERHGFRVTNVQAEHIFPYRIADYARCQCRSSAPSNAALDGTCCSLLNTYDFPSPRNVSLATTRATRMFGVRPRDLQR